MNREEINSSLLEKMINKGISIQLLNDENKLKGTFKNLNCEINSLFINSDSNDNDNEVKLENIIFAEISNLFEMKYKLNLNQFEIDTKLKSENKYKDDFETFKKKLEVTKIKDDEITNLNGLNDIKIIEKLEKLENLDEPLLNTTTDDNKIIQNENWDQFNFNKEKFNVKSTYTENKYTTDLNSEEIPENIKREAEIIEKSILQEQSKLRHLNEERGITNEIDNENEEFKYSSVYRNSVNKNKKSTKLNTPRQNEQKSFFNLTNLLLIFALIIFTIALISTIRNKLKNDNIDEDEEDEFMYDEEDYQY